MVVHIFLIKPTGCGLFTITSAVLQYYSSDWKAVGVASEGLVHSVSFGFFLYIFTK